MHCYARTFAYIYHPPQFSFEKKNKKIKQKRNNLNIKQIHACVSCVWEENVGKQIQERRRRVNEIEKVNFTVYSRVKFWCRLGSAFVCMWSRW